MEQIKVSVIIPVYNAMPFLEDNLKSLLSQTLEEIEIIYVDDKSTDDSLKLLRIYREHDNRIILIENQENVGVGVSRNVGFKMARGEYIAHLDADDYFVPNMLELMYKRATLSAADVVVCDYYEDDMLNHTIHEKRIPKWFVNRWDEDLLLEKKENRKYAINVIPHPTWNKLIKREFLEEKKILMQEIRSAADVFFGNAVVIAADHVAYMGDKCSCLIYYRKNTGKQITSNTNQYVMNLYIAEKKLHDFIDSCDNYRHFRASAFLHFYRGMSFYYDRLNRENKIKLFLYIKENYLHDFSYATWDKEEFYYVSAYINLKHFYDGDFSDNNLIDYQTNVFGDEIIEKLEKHKCVLWGFGKQGKAFYVKCKRTGYNIYGVIDVNANKIKENNNVDIVKSISELKHELFDAILVSSSEYLETIIKEIRGKGYDCPVIDIMPVGMMGVPFEECVYS